MMNFITQEQLNLFQTLFNCFPFFQRRKRKKPRGKFWFINLLQKLVLFKTMLTKKSERETDCFCKGLEPRLGGGQKYSQNRSKSSNKRKCHEGWSLKTLRVVVVLTTNHVGEYFDWPQHQNVRWREAKEVSDCDGFAKVLVGKANRSKVEGGNQLHQVAEVISERSD